MRSPIQYGSTYTCNGKTVIVVVVGAAKCRVIPAARLGGYFPESVLVDSACLTPTEQQPKFNSHDYRPTGLDTIWQYARAKGEPVQHVRVTRSGWKETRVANVADNGEDFSETFLVPNHQILTKPARGTRQKLDLSETG